MVDVSQNQLFEYIILIYQHPSLNDESHFFHHFPGDAIRSSVSWRANALALMEILDGEYFDVLT